MLIVILLCITPFTADKVEIIKENDESIVHLSGNVVIEDETARITCAEAYFNETKDYVVLIQEVEIVDAHGQISTDFARYHFNDKKGYLKGNVTLQRTDQIISSDSLYYSGLEDYIEMFGKVKIDDHENNLMAYGSRGWYNLQEDEGYLVDHPFIDIIREDREPIKIHALRFKLNNTNNVFYGFDSVVALIDSITVYCDTFVYNLTTENGSMIRPLIVEDRDELKGKSGQFRMNNKSIESLSVQKGMSQYYTKEGSINIIEGETIDIIFKDGKASHVIVEGKPKGVLHLKQREDNARHQESE